jgi:hypothetical protein
MYIKTNENDRVVAQNWTDEKPDGFIEIQADDSPNPPETAVDEASVLYYTDADGFWYEIEKRQAPQGEALEPVDRYKVNQETKDYLSSKIESIDDADTADTVSEIIHILTGEDQFDPTL